MLLIFTPKQSLSYLSNHTTTPSSNHVTIPYFCVSILHLYSNLRTLCSCAPSTYTIFWIFISSTAQIYFLLRVTKPTSSLFASSFIKDNDWTFANILLFYFMFILKLVYRWRKGAHKNVLYYNNYDSYLDIPKYLRKYLLVLKNQTFWFKQSGSWVACRFFLWFLRC